jgi:molybdopterin-guanine dinucleotide biosynthesis protein A
MPSAAILAGGRARRFDGRDKCLLTVDGRTMLDHLIGVASRVADDVLLIGRAPDAAADGARARLLRTPGHRHVRTAPDHEPPLGPLGGLDAALRAARFFPVLLLACDMPFLTAAFLAYLASLAGDADAVVPRTERGYHPLCAVYSAACAGAAAGQLASGDAAMKSFLAGIRVREVGPDEIGRFGTPDRLLANVNTPAEFEDLAALSGHKL